MKKTVAYHRCGDWHKYYEIAKECMEFASMCEKVAELEAQIEKMKCCQNCKNTWNGYRMNICEDCSNKSKWEIKENG